MFPIPYLDGRHFCQAVVAGADWVRDTREHINRINVFPVPDGDTGTNMALSLSATAAAVRALDEPHLGEVARRAAEASILGAKGNSGVIMAHWFLGLAESFSDESRLEAEALASALKAASDSVYEAVENPVEGTIVSVMRSVGEAAVETAAANQVHLGTLMESLFEAASEALARTPDQLEVLREANVVDAGALGYVNFLEGALRAVRGEPLPEPSEAELLEAVDQVAFEHDTSDLSERFCTEVVVRGKGFRSEQLKKLFRPLGSSLLVATTGTLFKLHVHTNHPDEVLKIAGRQGNIEEQKVDDMMRQRDERGGERQQPLIALEAQPDSVAVLCDSTSDLPQSIRRQQGIEMAPLQVLFGDRVFRDQIDISTEQFYQMLETDPHHPTTSQPPPRAFVEALDRIRSDREAIIVTVSRGVSGTYTSAQSGAALAPHPRTEVFDSQSASLGLGMMTLNAARLASMGAGLDDVIRWLQRWRDDTHMVLCLATLEYLRRGGRIGAAKSLIGGLLGLRPLIGCREGKIVPVANARSDADAFDRAMALIKSQHEEGTRVRLGLVETGTSGVLDRAEKELRQSFEVVEFIRAPATGVVGTHAGPGAWGVFFQRVRDDDPLE